MRSGSTHLLARSNNPSPRLGNLRLAFRLPRPHPTLPPTPPPPPNAPATPHRDTMPAERPVDPTLQPAPRLSTVQRVFVFGLLVVHVVLAWLTRAVSIGTGNDDATYILLARSVRHFEYLDRHL